ncbi:hypothetical protein ABIA38_008189 [Embleya sp. AB8]
MRTGGPDVMVRIGSMRFARGRAEHYLCTTCGYFEAYITDAETLAKAARKWEPCTPPPSGPGGT